MVFRIDIVRSNALQDQAGRKHDGEEFSVIEVWYTKLRSNK